VVVEREGSHLTTRIRHAFGSYSALADCDFVWIYSNPIYVVP
jgi:hypothetical protein